MEFHRFIPRPAKTTKIRALACMAVDVLATLLVIVFFGALLLVPSRRDAWIEL